MKDNWKKNTVLFLLSQTVSLFGTSLVQYAIMWYIVLRTESGVMMTMMIICGFLPSFFLSPFAGVWADRYNRKLLIILADAMTALTTLVLAILFYLGYDALWLLFRMAAVRAVGSGIQSPAIGAFLPQIVPEDKLMRINAANSSIQSSVMLVSPMVSGALLTMSTLETIFFIDVITAAIAVMILLVFLRVPVHAKALRPQASGYFGDMREGFSYIKKHKFIKAFFLFSTIFFILVAPGRFFNAAAGSAQLW